jgi:hypothetical protein
MNILLTVLLLLASSLIRAQQTQLEELQCDLNLVLGNDLTTGLATDGILVISNKTVSLLFALEDVELRSGFFARLHTPSVQVFAFSSSTSNQSLNAVASTWEQIEEAVTTHPGNFPACFNVSGCDGFVLDSTAFLRLFDRQARFFMMHFLVEFFEDAPVSRRRLLALGSVGFSDPLVLRMQFSEQLHTNAFATDYTDEFRIVMYSVISGIGLLLGCLLLCICCTSTAKPETIVHTDERAQLMRKQSPRRLRRQRSVHERAQLMRKRSPSRQRSVYEAYDSGDEIEQETKRITEEDLTLKAERDGVITRQQRRLHDQIELQVLRHAAGLS